ncbi:hypothetical protein PBY51_005631 [Eleginops maclovinus]|uniref:Uncharacterized protein n=1 Tax=Eleginops maclovinus TaxID=56733 RepID=A0AAN7X7R7_ELEMC|nr:hypothetical protein PBY51_005631 [Eleginops maclovinus]
MSLPVHRTLPAGHGGGGCFRDQTRGKTLETGSSWWELFLKSCLWSGLPESPSCESDPVPEFTPPPCSPHFLSLCIISLDFLSF